MMYSEFIEKSGYSENYITFTDYTNYIEPVYMNCDLSQKDFIRSFKKVYDKIVSVNIHIAIASTPVDTLENYVNGCINHLVDIEQLENTLKSNFLKVFKRKGFDITKI